MALNFEEMSFSAMGFLGCFLAGSWVSGFSQKLLSKGSVLFTETKSGRISLDKEDLAPDKTVSLLSGEDKSGVKELFWLCVSFVFLRIMIFR